MDSSNTSNTSGDVMISKEVGDEVVQSQMGDANLDVVSSKIKHAESTTCEKTDAHTTQQLNGDESQPTLTSSGIYADVFLLLR